MGLNPKFHIFLYQHHDTKVRKSTGPNRNSYLPEPPCYTVLTDFLLLLIRPSRLLLLGKSSHPNLLVFAAEQTMEHPSLKLDAIPDSEILTLIYHFLGRLDCNSTHSRDLLRRCNRTIHTFLRRLKHLSNQSPFPSLLPTESVPRQNELHSPALANRLGQPLTPSRTGDRAQLDLGLTKRGARRAVHDIRHHGQLAPAAQRVPVDGRDDGLLDLRNGARPHFDKVGFVGFGEGEVFHLFNVRAGREGLFAAGQDDGAGGGVRVEFSQGIVQFVEERCAEGV